MMKYFVKHLKQALIFVASALLLAFGSFYVGSYIGEKVDNTSIGFAVIWGIIVFIGIVHYAYSQAKIEMKYQSK